MRIAVLGATGTAGTRVVQRLHTKGVEVIEVSRAKGVDLVSGRGLVAALDGVDVVIDASNALPSDGSMEWEEALTTATRNAVEACIQQRVSHLVFLSITGIENPVFDDFPYYLAKRRQEAIVEDSGLNVTLVRTTQWYEFATNPAVVTFQNERVEVQNWLVQPVAVNAVADLLVQEVLDSSGQRKILIAGPEQIHLPELVRRKLQALGDQRPVHTIEPYLPELAKGVLTAPDQAQVIGPNVEGWLATLT